MRLSIPIVRLDPELPLPGYAHAGDAGFDLYSAIDITIPAGERVLIPTGIAMAIPEGHAGFVQPRSGLALRAGLSMANSPGLIDSHYRGEIKVIAINLDPREPITVERGTRIAQMVVLPVDQADLVEVSALDETRRGEGGFGSTGV